MRSWGQCLTCYNSLFVCCGSIDCLKLTVGGTCRQRRSRTRNKDCLERTNLVDNCGKFWCSDIKRVYWCTTQRSDIFASIVTS
jgi:hypothetical protein